MSVELELMETVAKGEQDYRWNLKVSKETDLILRAYLGSQGMRKGDLSKFIEDAVRRRVLQLTVEEIKENNADFSEDELQRMIDDAVSEVRIENRPGGKAAKA